VETKNRLPWKTLIGERSSTGALTKEQISDLAKNFGIGTAPLFELSRDLAPAVAEILNVSNPELVPPKTDKGIREAKKAVQALVKAEKYLTKAQELVAHLNMKNPWAHVGLENPGPQQTERLLDAIGSVASFRNYLDTMARNRYVMITGVPDQRKTHDVRREIVTTTIFNFWEKRGRKLTITTDPVKGERTGDLVKFVNAIVANLTEPPCPVPGETIHADLQSFKSKKRKV